MKVKVRNFGQDTVVNSPQALEHALVNEYAGLSVSIDITLPSGVRHIHHVDVDEFGQPFDANGAYPLDKPFTENATNI